MSAMAWHCYRFDTTPWSHGWFLQVCVRPLDERVIVRTVDCFVTRVCSITSLPHVQPCGALDSELHLITRRVNQSE